MDVEDEHTASYAAHAASNVADDTQRNATAVNMDAQKRRRWPFRFTTLSRAHMQSACTPHSTAFASNMRLWMAAVDCTELLMLAAAVDAEVGAMRATRTKGVIEAFFGPCIPIEHGVSMVTQDGRQCVDTAQADGRGHAECMLTFHRPPVTGQLHVWINAACIPLSIPRDLLVSHNTRGTLPAWLDVALSKLSDAQAAENALDATWSEQSEAQEALVAASIAQQQAKRNAQQGRSLARVIQSLASGLAQVVLDNVIAHLKTTTESAAMLAQHESCEATVTAAYDASEGLLPATNQASMHSTLDNAHEAGLIAHSGVHDSYIESGVVCRVEGVDYQVDDGDVLHTCTTEYDYTMYGDAQASGMYDTCDGSQDPQQATCCTQEALGFAQDAYATYSGVPNTYQTEWIDDAATASAPGSAWSAGTSAAHVYNDAGQGDIGHGYGVPVPGDDASIHGGRQRQRKRSRRKAGGDVRALVSTTDGSNEYAVAGGDADVKKRSRKSRARHPSAHAEQALGDAHAGVPYTHALGAAEATDTTLLQGLDDSWLTDGLSDASYSLSGYTISGDMHAPPADAGTGASYAHQYAACNDGPFHALPNWSVALDLTGYNTREGVSSLSPYGNAQKPVNVFAKPRRPRASIFLEPETGGHNTSSAFGPRCRGARRTAPFLPAISEHGDDDMSTHRTGATRGRPPHRAVCKTLGRPRNVTRQVQPAPVEPGALACTLLPPLHPFAVARATVYGALKVSRKRPGSGLCVQELASEAGGQQWLPARQIPRALLAEAMDKCRADKHQVSLHTAGKRSVGTIQQICFTLPKACTVQRVFEAPLAWQVLRMAHVILPLFRKLQRDVAAEVQALRARLKTRLLQKCTYEAVLTTASDALLKCALCRSVRNTFEAQLRARPQHLMRLGNIHLLAVLRVGEGTEERYRAHHVTTLEASGQPCACVEAARRIRAFRNHVRMAIKESKDASARIGRLLYGEQARSGILTSNCNDGVFLADTVLSHGARALLTALSSAEDHGAPGVPTSASAAYTVRTAIKLQGFSSNQAIAMHGQGRLPSADDPCVSNVNADGSWWSAMSAHAKAALTEMVQVKLPFAACAGDALSVACPGVMVDICTSLHTLCATICAPEITAVVEDRVLDCCTLLPTLGSEVRVEALNTTGLALQRIWGTALPGFLNECAAIESNMYKAVWQEAASTLKRGAAFEDSALQAMYAARNAAIASHVIPPTPACVYCAAESRRGGTRASGPHNMRYAALVHTASAVAAENSAHARSHAQLRGKQQAQSSRQDHDAGIITYGAACVVYACVEKRMLALNTPEGALEAWRARRPACAGTHADASCVACDAWLYSGVMLMARHARPTRHACDELVTGLPACSLCGACDAFALLNPVGAGEANVTVSGDGYSVHADLLDVAPSNMVTGMHVACRACNTTQLAHGQSRHFDVLRRPAVHNDDVATFKRLLATFTKGEAGDTRIGGGDDGVFGADVFAHVRRRGLITFAVADQLAERYVMTWTWRLRDDAVQTVAFAATDDTSCGADRTDASIFAKRDKGRRWNEYELFDMLKIALVLEGLTLSRSSQ